MVPIIRLITVYYSHLNNEFFHSLRVSIRHAIWNLDYLITTIFFTQQIFNKVRKIEYVSIKLKDLYSNLNFIIFYFTIIYRCLQGFPYDFVTSLYSLYPYPTLLRMVEFHYDESIIMKFHHSYLVIYILIKFQISRIYVYRNYPVCHNIMQWWLHYHLFKLQLDTLLNIA